MPRIPDPSRRAWEQLVEAQSGVVSRAQALAAGVTSGQIRHHVRRGDWQALHPGVYLTHTGPQTFVARVWAAVLYAGADAVISHRSAARLQGLVDDDPARIDVTVPQERRVRTQPGLSIRRTADLASRRHPARRPPMTSIDNTVLDLVDRSRSEDDVVSWVLRACQRRLTTPARLTIAAAARSRLRHRRLVSELLDDAATGVASALERRYLRQVERSHGLPQGDRGVPWIGIDGRRRYDDVRYAAWRVRVELEGLAFHPADRAWVDQSRDNEATLVGDVVLRYGWRQVTRTPCEVAAQVAAVLTLRGWPAPARGCGPGCAVMKMETSRRP